MAKQILAGTTGIYFGEKKFVVLQDTCFEAEKLPVRFLDSGKESWIRFIEITSWINKLTKDF